MENRTGIINGSNAGNKYKISLVLVSKNDASSK